METCTIIPNEAANIQNELTTNSSNEILSNVININAEQSIISLSQKPRKQKHWHDSITVEMRVHLVKKFMQTIFSSKDQNIYNDPRLSNLANYAKRTESMMYEQAKDQEEYFHLLAERIYKIQKEFSKIDPKILTSMHRKYKKSSRLN